MNAKNSDIIVIGGGIIGLMTARELARDGRRIMVIERGRLGMQASRAAGGILSPLYPWQQPQAVQQLSNLAMRQYPDLIRRLEAATGHRIGCRRSGLMILDVNEHAAALAWAAHWGWPAERLDGAALRGSEPGLGPVADTAVLLPAACNLYTVDLIAALQAELRATGVRLEENREVEDLELDATGGAVVRVAGERLRPAAVVVAGGAWSGMLVRRLGPRLPVRPVRGQIVQYPKGAARLEHMLLHRSRYLVPRPGGEIIAGSTLEEAGFDTSVTEAARQELTAAAASLLPALAGVAPEDHWSGLRPGSPEGVPFIGPVPELPGLWLNTGHFQNGILLAPAAARLLADLMAGREPPIDPLPFALLDRV
jgi:glycine oxidase